MEDKTLYLTLKKEFYDLIESGVKKDEYRTIKPYWQKRLIKVAETLDANNWCVQFANGYAKDCRKMRFKINDIERGLGNPGWGAPELECVFIIKLGDKIPMI